MRSVLPTSEVVVAGIGLYLLVALIRDLGLGQSDSLCSVVVVHLDAQSWDMVSAKYFMKGTHQSAHTFSSLLNDRSGSPIRLRVKLS